MNVHNDNKTFSGVKINKNQNVFLKYIYFAILFVTLSYFCVLPLRNIQVRHVIVFVGSSLFYFLAILRLKQSKYKLNSILRILLIIGLIGLGIIISSTNKYLELIYTSLNFLTFFILMSTDNPFVLTEKMMRWTFRIFLLMAAVLFIVANSSTAYLFEDGRSTTALALGMTNPNLTAMMLLSISNILLIKLKDSHYKILLFTILAYICYLLWLTEARSSIIAFSIAFFYYLLFSNKKISNFLILLIFLGVLAFAPVYMYLFGTGLEGEFLGKNIFSGRVRVFNEYLSLLYTRYYLLFGNLGEVQFANAHNAPISIMSSIGIVGLVVAYFSYYLQLIKINKHSATAVSNLAIVCLLCMYIQSCAEATFFTGVFPGISFMFLYTVLANGVIKD